MNRITDNGHVNAPRYCEDCDNALIDDARHHDGSLLCPACWAERRAADEREAIEEAEGEIEEAARDLEERRREHEQALAELECEYSEDLATLRRRMQTWQKRANRAHKALRELGAIGAAVGGVTSDKWQVASGEKTSPDPDLPLVTSHLPLERSDPLIQPVCGGGEPFEPTDEDLADFATWAAEMDARRDAEERDRVLEESEIERPMWGYE